MSERKPVDTKKNQTPMPTFPTNIKFCHPWREYQARVLAELEEHLDDDRLHIVAPPGSGKTVLGLEVLRRLDHPTLILSPTLTIRNQWIDRFVELFLPKGNEKPDWISDNLHAPALMTVTTYQALHSVFSGKDEPEEDLPEEEEASEARVVKKRQRRKHRRAALIKAIRELGVRTLVVDEAHHLKNEWWKAIFSLIDEIENPVIVALTATPPYDVAFSEWERYKKLCGPIDSEISVPELMLEEDLAPHQDYVYISYPTDSEASELKVFHEEVDAVFDDIFLKTSLFDCVIEHPWILDPDDYAESILDNPEFYSSMIIFLKQAGGLIDNRPAGILGVRDERIPELDREWLSIFLTGVFFHNNPCFILAEDDIKDIRKRLRKVSAIEREKVVLTGNARLQKKLDSSVSKLESISEIVSRESAALTLSLRMVILTDYIRKDDMPAYIGDDRPMNRIGVVPIFEHLRRQFNTNIRLGVLSGSMVIIPEEAILKLKLLAAEWDMSQELISISPLKHDPQFVYVRLASIDQRRMVALITQLFTDGNITVLVGTKSLLGEGWDAPCINSLILATVVGSYVLSNQMRGRAIRVQLDNPDKTANIWHLVCVELERWGYGHDLNNLRRRFKAFAGVRFSSPGIQNGINRLDMLRDRYSESNVAAINEMMFEKALDREKLAGDWDAALAHSGTGSQMMQEVLAPRPRAPRELVINRQRQAAKKDHLQVLWSAIAFIGTWFPGLILKTLRLPRILLIIPIIAGIFLVDRSYEWYKASKARRQVDVDEMSISMIGYVFLKSLIEMKVIKDPTGQIEVVTGKTPDGKIYCHLNAGTTQERTLFLNAVSEVLAPVVNPRYLIVSTSGDLNDIDLQYYPLPTIFSKKRKSANIVERHWQKTIGPCEVVFTRNRQGRRELLTARLMKMGHAEDAELERISVWR